MKYATCPNCGRRLCKAEIGSKVEIECPKCGEPVVVQVDDAALHIKSNTTKEKQAKQA